MTRTTGWLFLNHMLHEPDVFKGRLGRSRDNAMVSCGSVLVSLMFSGLVVGQEPPRFRVRTDAHSVLDADVLREELRVVTDSRGPVNPLGDYGPKGASQMRIAGRGSAGQDDEANRRPELDEAARKRLERTPPSVSGQDLHVVTLLPPPRWVGSATSGIVVPAGWGSQGVGGVSFAGGVDDGFRPIEQDRGAVRFANYLQQVDPQANVPPSLSVPGLGVPSAGLPSSGLPSLPTTGYPPVALPSVGVPSVGVPSGIPSNVPSGIPSSIPSGIPVGGVSGVAPATMPSGAVPTAVYPAPPSYVVPVPTGSVPTGPVGSVAGASVAGGGYPVGGVNGYVGSPMPTYSRAGTFVNSAPFVTPAPASVDARWMVSPAVWQQASRGVNDPNCVPASGVQWGGNPVAGGSGVVGVVPNAGLVPAATRSPFAYAPPAAMPPATVYAPANGGYVPLVGFGQGANAQLGRGLYGQPTAYVDGQPVRNFLRYIFP